MSGKKTLVWTVILLVLAAFYYTYEIQGGQKRQEEASKRELLFHFVMDDVTGFTVKREQETVRAEKRDGHWYLTEPLAVRGDERVPPSGEALGTLLRRGPGSRDRSQ